jgi:hypothetical protein
LERGQVFAEDDEIIRITDDGQFVSLWQGCRDGCFETMQSNVGEQG